MGVQFLRLDEPSRELLNQMLARKAAGRASGAVRSRRWRGGGVGRASDRHATAPTLAADRHQRRPGAEFGIDEARLRRAVDRNWLRPDKASGEIEELEGLLRPEPTEPVTLAQALAEMPRLLDPRAPAA